MSKKIRLLFAALVFLLSLMMLIWGYSPNPRETRIQNISPAEMQLPAP